MTGFNAAGITSAIAGMSVSGVKILDVGDVPESVTYRMCPVLMPREEWLGGGGGSPAADSTFSGGVPTARGWQAKRTFHYLFLENMVGQGRGVRKIYASAAVHLETIWEALLNLDVTNVEVLDVTHTRLGTMVEANVPDSNEFVGALFDILIREWINP